MPAIEVTGLRRTFQRRRFTRPVGDPVVALDGVDLRVDAGETHGLLGPNGAGKTTLCKILSTVLLPTGGSARVAGFDVIADVQAVRERIGIVFGGDRGLYGRLTVRQNLRHWAALYGLRGSAVDRRVAELLDRFGLADRQNDRVETFSRGMKQRVHLARGLLADPQVLLLDEPTDGLDPISAAGLRTLVGELHREGKTILVTTHDMADAEQICDRVSFIDGGRVITTDSPAALAAAMAELERFDVGDLPAGLLRELTALDGVDHVDDLGGGRVRFHCSGKEAGLSLLRALVDHGVSDIRSSPPSLEEVYVRLIGDRGMGLR